MLNANFKWAVLTALAAGVCYTAAVELAPDDLDSSEGVTVSEEVIAPPVEVPAPTALYPKWQAPDYSKQESALGWTPDAFSVPKGMEERVQFWKDIYTKYTSDQGVLHDSRYMHLMYDTLDFSDITAKTDLTDRQKEKLRKKRVDEKKKDVVARMKRISELKDPAGLVGEDLRYWEMFAKVDEPKKFIEAARKGRLRFQLGQRNQFMNGIYQSGRYMKQMEEIFRQEGLPIELTRLPFVESSFNLRARSRVGASGIWQFMRSAARSYMRMDTAADERNDPLRATRAAAKKMKDNFQILKSWPIAVTAYNHGQSGMRRLTEKLGTTDLAELTDVRRGRFGFASANFYASFLAAVDVERNADKHFGVLEVMPELRGAEVKLIKSASSKQFMKWFHDDVELAKSLNPHILEHVWRGRMPLSRKHILRVPLKEESQARGEME